MGAKRFNRPFFDHNQPERIGVVVANLGTPDAPTAPAVRTYLGQFLHDWRVIEISRWLWCPLLHGIILRTRPKKVAAIYQAIWTEEGSPLLVITRKQAEGLKTRLQAHFPQVEVAVAMRYGNPSMQAALEELRAKNCQKILVLPMYPQYSCATSASTLDSVFSELKHWRWMPELRTINDYSTHEGYIQALANSVVEARAHYEMPEKLVISFHGTPVSFRDQGDPYYYRCKATAHALATALDLKEEQWILTFQSQFGNDPWIKPSTSDTLESLAKSGVKSVDVICPGFSADCIETLEEIEDENREIFEENGGEAFHYVPALNDRDDHLDALNALVTQHLGGWV